MKVAAIFLATVCSAAAQVQTGEQPTSDDLRAAYCLEVTKSHAAIFEGLLRGDGNPPEVQRLLGAQAEREHDVLRRLELYLFPRLDRLDPTQIILAQQSARADMDALAKVGNFCMANAPECGPHQPVADALACSERCAEGRMPTFASVRARVTACQSPNWLPM
jgi:hypothetical protein